MQCYRLNTNIHCGKLIKKENGYGKGKIRTYSPIVPVEKLEARLIKSGLIKKKLKKQGWFFLLWQRIINVINYKKRRAQRLLDAFEQEKEDWYAKQLKEWCDK